MEEFIEVLKRPEFLDEIGQAKREILAERAQSTSAITFQDFVNIVSYFYFINKFIPILFMGLDCE